jgi:hypothetical protein
MASETDDITMIPTGIKTKHTHTHKKKKKKKKKERKKEEKKRKRKRKKKDIKTTYLQGGIEAHIFRATMDT